MALLWFKIAIVSLTAVNLLLLGFLMIRPGQAVTRGRLLPLLGFLILPALISVTGGMTHLEQTKSTQFCLSCHVMEPYGRSLRIDHPDYLPAQHYQNRRISRQQACYDCHTSYTMYGGLQAKLTGLRHLYVNYLGRIPERLSLYSPYQNRECLYCHSGARSYEEQPVHSAIGEALRSNQTSCLECHGQVHHVQGLEDHPLWKEGM